MGSVRWRTAIGRPLFFFSQEITIRLIKKDKGVMEDKKLTMPMIALRGLGHDGSAAHRGDGVGSAVPVRDFRLQQCAAVCGHGEYGGVKL